MKKHAKKIGERNFPLEINVEEIERNHPLVGRIAEVSPFARVALKDHIGEDGKVTGVILHSGQVVGYEVECEDEKLLGTRKDFYVEKNLIKNAHIQSAQALYVREVLKEWMQPSDRVKGDGDSIEAFFFDVATITSKLAIELQWADDKQSVWKYTIPSLQGDIVLHAHIAAHDGVWSIGLQVYSTREQCSVPAIGDPDHWTRTLMWTHRSLNLVQKSKRKYQVAMRISENERLVQMGKLMIPTIVRAYYQRYGEIPICPGLSLGFSRWRVQPGHVGLYEPPTEDRKYGVLSIHPKAREKGKDYLHRVLLHELLHYAMAEVPFEDPHGEEFQELATLVGLPKSLQD